MHRRLLWNHGLTIIGWWRYFYSKLSVANPETLFRQHMTLIAENLRSSFRQAFDLSFDSKTVEHLLLQHERHFKRCNNETMIIWQEFQAFNKRTSKQYKHITTGCILMLSLSLSFDRHDTRNFRCPYKIMKLEFVSAIAIFAVISHAPLSSNAHF